MRLNYIDLTFLLGASFGLPIMMIGGELTRAYGQSVALSSILIGNFILWLLGLAMFSMAKTGTNALENIQYYLGKKTVFILAIIWLFSFLMWFVVRIKATTETISFLTPDTRHLWMIGWSLSIMTTILATKGFKLIKKISYFIFPLLIVLSVYFLLIDGKNHILGGWKVSFIGILTIVFAWLPITLNIPTIFQYSISRADSIIGLTFITLSHIFFQIFAVVTRFDDPKMILINFGFPAVLIFLLSSLMGNFLNLHFAKTALDILYEKRKVPYFFVGLLGTFLYLLFFFIPFFSFAGFLEKSLLNLLAILCVVLLFDYFIKAIIQHRPRSLEKFWSSFCWTVGSVVSTVIEYKGGENGTIIGVGVCSLIFLSLLFIEETLWAIHKLRERIE
jgi:purine-cytosine permease-like protein